MMTIVLFIFFVAGAIFSFRPPEKVAERGLRKIKESGLTEEEKNKKIAIILSSVKLMRIGLIIGAIFCLFAIIFTRGTR